MGAGMGLAIGAGGPWVAAAALVGGAATSFATGGLEGLGDFAGDVLGFGLGATAGYYAGNAMVHGTTDLNLAGQPRRVPRNKSLVVRASTALTTDNKPVVSSSNSSATATTNLDGPSTIGQRYVGSGEAAEASRSGYAPNVDQYGKTKTVFYTPDEGVNSASQAKSMYNLTDVRTYRLTLDTSRVTTVSYTHLTLPTKRIV